MAIANKKKEKKLSKSIIIIINNLRGLLEVLLEVLVLQRE